MGIATAIAGVGSVVGSLISSSSAADAAEEQAETLSAAASQYSPYMTAGSDAVSQMASYSGVSGMDDFTSDYLSSDTYSMYEDQLTESALKTASATGGLRSGSSEVALAEIAPSLVSSAYDTTMSNLSGLSSMGLSATSGYGNLMSSSASSEYEADSTMGNWLGSSISSLSGLGLTDYGSTDSTSVYTRPGQTYGR